MDRRVSELMNMLKNPNFNDFFKAGELIRDIKRDRKLRDKEKILLQHFRKITSEIAKNPSNFFEWSSDQMLRNAFVVSGHLVLNGLKTTQIRKVLSLASKINSKLKLKKGEIVDVAPDIAKLRFILAYSTARNEEVRPLMEILDKILPVVNKNNFDKFYEFLQAIVAYHRFSGGAD